MGGKKGMVKRGKLEDRKLSFRNYNQTRYRRRRRITTVLSLNLCYF